MKRLLLGVLAVMTVFSLTACGKNEETPENNETPVETAAPAEETTPAEEATPAEETTPNVENVEQSGEETLSGEEQVGVGNTDASMVALVLENHFKTAFPDAVEEVIPTNIKVYTAEEIEANEAIKEHNIQEGDIVFEANYDLKIKEGVEDLNQFTAATGEIDGQWVRNKFNLGIAKSGENGYTLEAFGTGW